MSNDWGQWPPDLQTRYNVFYIAAAAAGHHIHGCNLGLTAAAYQMAGGGPHVLVGEDRALLTAARATRLGIEWDTEMAVRTSGAAMPESLAVVSTFLATMI